MLARIKKWYALDVFEKEEDRQAARILLFAMHTASVISLVTILSGILWGPTAIVLVGVLGILMQGIVLILFARGNLTAAGFIFGAGALLLITLVAMRGYGVHDIIIMAYPVVTFLSVLVLNRAWSVAIAILTLLAVCGLVLGEALSLFTVPVHFSTRLQELLGVLGILAVSFLLTNLQAGNIRLTLQNARQEIARREVIEAKLRFVGTHDMLTGAHNRLFLDEELIRLEHSRDYPISIILSDMDDLKETNDKLGHDTGDELIRRAYQVLHASIREEDVLARIGGDEFAIVLPRTGEEKTGEILGRIRKRIREFNASHPDMLVRLSLGAATSRRGRLEETFREADQHMYADKASRRRGQDTIPLPGK